MLANVYRIIETALDLDHTLTDEDKETILTVCRRPRSGTRAGPEAPERLINMREVCTLLSVSRTTVWRMMHDGRLPVVMIGSCPRFRLANVQTIVAGLPLGQ